MCGTNSGVYDWRLCLNQCMCGVLGWGEVIGYGDSHNRHDSRRFVIVVWCTEIRDLRGKQDEVGTKP